MTCSWFIRMTICPVTAWVSRNGVMDESYLTGRAVPDHQDLRSTVLSGGSTASRP